MRIIHTADWHLCDKLGHIDRTDDLKARVETVAALCEEHAADVLLVAGDLFSEQASVDEMTRALNHVRDVFKPFFARGGTVLVITGNHDRDGRINMVRVGMTLAAPDAGATGVLPNGRMYLINGRAVATLAGAMGDRVQFVLVPYPFASRYDLSATDYRSREEETRLLHGKVAEWVQGVASKPGFDPALPTVLAAHLHVRGAELHTLYKMTKRDDVLFDFADLNPMWAYVALGHIHKPQTLSGAATVRYPACGTWYHNTCPVINERRSQGYRIVVFPAIFLPDPLIEHTVASNRMGKMRGSPLTAALQPCSLTITPRAALGTAASAPPPARSGSTSPAPRTAASPDSRNRYGPAPRPPAPR